jgi:hypothetical protein
VGKLSVIPVHFETMKELTLERSPMNVSNVEKLLDITKLFKYMKGLTQEKSPITV